MKKGSNPGRQILQGTGAGLCLTGGSWLLFFLFLSLTSILFVRDWHLLKESISSIKDESNESLPFKRIPCMAMFIIVAIRAYLRTPISPKYRQLISTTPWQPGKPLPGGNIPFSIRVWATIISGSLFGILILGISWWAFPLAAFLGHGLAIGSLLFFTDRFWPIPYAITIILLAWAFFFEGIYFPLVFLVALYLPINAALHRSLEEIIYGQSTYSKCAQPLWPSLPPSKNTPPYSNSKLQKRSFEWLPQAIIVGLICFALCREETEPALVFSVIAAAFLLKTLFYLWRKPASISLMGRIRRGPLITPEYDRVFLPVILAVVCLSLALASTRIIPWQWMPHFTGLISAIATAAFLKLFPTLDYWTYLAPGRIGLTPPSGSQEYKRI